MPSRFVFAKVIFYLCLVIVFEWKIVSASIFLLISIFIFLFTVVSIVVFIFVFIIVLIFVLDTSVAGHIAKVVFYPNLVLICKEQ